MTNKPRIYWATRYGAWVVLGKRPRTRNLPEGPIKDAQDFCNKLNYYKGPDNRQARLLSAWASQGEWK